ncbi:MAG: alpha/beta hydrolase [Planctomycetaceae bacterium]|nr:alpha/beta hydrolase [Planctomycetaceae bacterium]
MRNGALIVAMWFVFAPLAANAAEPAVTITPDVVYGHKDGLAMTFDVFTPTQNAKGVGVLFMVSGGWYSGWQPPEQAQAFYKPVTDAGYTAFAVRHGSSPKYGIPDAVSDVRRAVRFIRLHASDYGIDPNRIGVYGMSAGGHLSLMLGTGSDEGKADDADPVLRVSDRVQAVVAFVAPTDLTIMVHSAPNHLPAYDGFPALALDMDGAKTHSPLLLVSNDDAPTLLLAGAKDDLVPIDHSRHIRDALDKEKVAVKLVEFPNAGHGFGPEDGLAAFKEMLAWFDTHLAAK